jgi:hypothetical protein
MGESLREKRKVWGRVIALVRLQRGRRLTEVVGKVAAATCLATLNRVTSRRGKRRLRSRPVQRAPERILSLCKATANSCGKSDERRPDSGDSTRDAGLSDRSTAGYHASSQDACRMALRGSSSTPRHASLRAVAQPGSAFDWGSKGRRFESCRPDLRSRNSERDAAFLCANREVCRPVDPFRLRGSTARGSALAGLNRKRMGTTCRRVDVFGRRSYGDICRGRERKRTKCHRALRSRIGHCGWATAVIATLPCGRGGDVPRRPRRPPGRGSRRSVRESRPR